MLNNPLNVSMIMDQTRTASALLQQLIEKLAKDCLAEHSDHKTLLLKGAGLSQSMQRFVR